VTLVDTSSWVPFLRRDGDHVIKERVGRLLHEGTAVVCPIVLTELWMGAGSEKDRADVLDMQNVLPCLAMNRAVWERSYKLAKTCRAHGTPVPASDLIIAACAFIHEASIEANDKHFRMLVGYRGMGQN